MKYFSALGWGIVIYALMYLAWSGFVIYGFAQGIGPRICGLAVLVLVSTIAGRALKFSSWKDVLPYSIAWCVVVALLDIVFTVPFSGWGLYSDWNIWIGYALVVLVPLLAPYTRQKTS